MVIVVPALAVGQQRTHQRFVELSRVGCERYPQMWVAEFTSQVECRTKTDRTKPPQTSQRIPPTAYRPAKSSDREDDMDSVRSTDGSGLD